MSKKRAEVTVLGGGLGGVSLAYFLKEQGVPCRLFEKDSRLGGICRSTTVGKFTFDYCGHLLHFKHKSTLPLIKKLLGSNLAEHKRNAFIYSFDRLRRYPFQVNLHGLPHPVVKKCLIDFIQVHTNGARYRLPRNFREWSHKNFGEGITEYFMRPYNEKFWTVPLDELSHQWAQGLVIIPTYRQMVEGTVEESKRNLGYNSFFWYPRETGIEALIAALSKNCPGISLDSDVTEIDLIRKRVRFKDGRTIGYTQLVSTLPLPDLGRIIKDLPKDIRAALRTLRWVSIFNINLGIKRKLPGDRHWIYFPDQNTSFFRVGFFHNFSRSLAPEENSSLYVEVSYSLWKPVDRRRITRQVIEDLNKVGILKKTDKIVASNVHDIRYAYPLYDLNYQAARERVISFLKENGVICCGRYGSWRYMSMEDVMIEAEHIAGVLAEDVSACKN